MVPKPSKTEGFRFENMQSETRVGPRIKKKSRYNLGWVSGGPRDGMVNRKGVPSPHSPKGFPSLPQRAPNAVVVAVVFVVVVAAVCTKTGP